MDLAGQAVLQRLDVGDHTDELVAPGQPGQRVDGLFQTVGIQRAEALVDEQRLDHNAARVLLDRVADAQRQTQRGHKALAAGQAAHGAGLAGIGVEHVEVERCFAADCLAFAAQQPVLAVGHPGEAQVRGLDDAVKIERLYVLFKGQFDLARQIAVDRLGQIVPHSALFAGGGALLHRLLQGVQRGTVRVQAVHGSIAGFHRCGAVALQPVQGVAQLLQRVGVVPLGHRLPHLLDAGGGRSVPGLRVGGAAGGSKALLVEVGQLAAQNLGLLRQALGAVSLLLQLQVVGLQAAQPFGKAGPLLRQGGFQLVGGQFCRRFSGVALPSTREKSICIALQCHPQLVGVGGGVTGLAAGGGRTAALGGQRFFALFQLLFGDVILRQRRDLRVLGRAADRAGLAVLQFLRQQACTVSVQLTLHRAVFFLGAVECCLRGDVLGLAGGGIGLRLVCSVRVLQKALAVSGQPLGQLNAVVGFQQLGLGLTQGKAVGLVAGDVRLDGGRALFQVRRDEGGLVLDIGGALLLGDQLGQLGAAGGALLGDLHACVAARQLLVQLLHNIRLVLLVRLVGLQQVQA